jgi:hypothetical protein
MRPESREVEYCAIFTPLVPKETPQIPRVSMKRLRRNSHELLRKCHPFLLLAATAVAQAFSNFAARSSAERIANASGSMRLKQLCGVPCLRNDGAGVLE